MPEVYPVIRAPRLDLVLMSPPLMRSMYLSDWAAAGHLLGARIPQEWRAASWPGLATRAAEAEADPSLIPWFPRVQVLRQTAGRGGPVIVGETGFHGPPDAGGCVEIGYSVVAGHRRRGFAEEAVRALTAWAACDRGVTRFRARIAPRNIPSLNLIRKLGFAQAGTCQHELLGELLIFHRDGAPG